MLILVKYSNWLTSFLITLCMYICQLWDICVFGNGFFSQIYSSVTVIFLSDGSQLFRNVNMSTICGAHKQWC